ncbi:Dynein heavy chain 8, axonemal [Chelonia mydas]|uniref:Dynein heavy chain 8, axonemal n=1 Tax=Chelonia mydas TaxID=8469 RepID=M7AHM9_CHEMY|nr:Dynein heavy chain 8, axonemal [Chelonia mydas]
MRKEADDSGPLTELEHWKRMSAKFNFIIEQIKGPSCKAVINVLNVGHSKLLKMWRELDARITDTANESKDNVRYLYTLEKVCQPLYNYDLVSMAHGIQNLINAIRMIHSVSRYYNTSERMTSLFIKITEMITIVQTFSALSMSTIEGIDIMAIKFKNIYQSVQKKQYDILDPRKTEFDVDFVDFMTKIESLEHSVQLLQRFQKLNMPCLKQEIAHTVGLILQHYVAELEATKKLYQAQKDDPPLARNMPPVAGKILWVRQLFRRISEPINFFYKHSDILTSPEGKAVVRLFNKISYVLVEFEVLYHMAWVKEISQLQYALQATLLVRHPETGKLLVNFDPKILEIVRETKCMIKMGLEVPEQAKRVVKMENVLKTNKLYLEVESVLRQGLTILTWSSLTLDSFFQEVDEVMNMFKQLLKKSRHDKLTAERSPVNSGTPPGREVQAESMGEHQPSTYRSEDNVVNDLCEMQIDLIMKDISNTVLIVLPEDGPIKMEDMLARNETYTKEWAEILNHKSMHIEDAVQELISIFETIYEIKDSKKTLKKYSLPVKGKHVAFGGDGEEGDTDGSSGILSEDAEDNEKEDEFRKVMVPSLDDIQQAINRMIQLTLEVSRGVAHWGQQHLQKSSILLNRNVPVVSSSPSMVAGKTAKKEEKVLDDSIPVRKLKNFYPGVAEHKDISKLVVLLSSSVNSVRKAASEALQDFQKYKVLWTEDRDAKVQVREPGLGGYWIQGDKQFLAVGENGFSTCLVCAVFNIPLLIIFLVPKILIPVASSSAETLRLQGKVWEKRDSTVTDGDRGRKTNAFQSYLRVQVSSRHSKVRLALSHELGPLGICTGTPWTLGHTETFVMLEDIFLPYLQSPLLLGLALLRDVLTPEEERLLLSQERSVFDPLGRNSSIPAVPLLPMQLSSESEDWRR